MTPLCRLRRFLGLRQIDVERATGVSVSRLSAAERGMLTLTETEQRLVSAYLADRLRIEGQSPDAAIFKALERESGRMGRVIARFDQTTSPHTEEAGTALSCAAAKG